MRAVTVFSDARVVSLITINRGSTMFDQSAGCA
jgi:hypothetical protein